MYHIQHCSALQNLQDVKMPGAPPETSLALPMSSVPSHNALMTHALITLLLKDHLSAGGKCVRTQARNHTAQSRKRRKLIARFVISRRARAV